MTKKQHDWKIRWREQGQPYEETIVKARTEHEALTKLKNKLLLERGIGYHYLWIVWTMDCSVDECMITKCYYIKRVNEILGEGGF